MRSLFIFSLFLFVSVFFISTVEGQSKKKKRVKLTESDSITAEKLFLDAEKYYILEDYAKAFNLFQKSLDIIADNPAAHFKMAQVLYNEQDFEGALTHALQAKNLNSSNKFYHQLVAEIYRAMGNLTDAALAYEEMIEKVPSARDALLDLAIVYLYQPDYQKALDTYDKAEKLIGLTEEIILQKQKIFLKLNDLEGAIGEAERLKEMRPGEYGYVLNLARIYTSNGQNEKALPILENYRKNNPEDSEPCFELYELYTQEGRFTDANRNLKIIFEDPSIEPVRKASILAEKIAELPNADIEEEVRNLLKTALSTHSESAELLATSGDFHLKLEELRKARNEYIKAVKIDGSSYDLWQNIISVSFTLEDFSTAANYSESALEFFPNQGYLYYINGAANYALKDYQVAASSFETSKKLTRNNPELIAEINARLGDTYNNLEDYDKSDKSYDAALAYNPDFDHVLNNYSYFLSLRKERLDEAKRMSSRLIRNNPDNATFLDTHAWVLYNLGEYKEALKFLEKAVEDKPSPVILEHYGDVLFKLGRVEEAVEQWEKAKGLDSTSELIDKKIADRQLYE